MIDKYVLLVYIDGVFHRASRCKDCITDKMYEDLYELAHDTHDRIDAIIEAVETVMDANKIKYEKITVETGAKSNKIYIWNE